MEEVVFGFVIFQTQLTFNTCRNPIVGRVT